MPRPKTRQPLMRRSPPITSIKGPNRALNVAHKVGRPQPADRLQSPEPANIAKKHRQMERSTVFMPAWVHVKKRARLTICDASPIQNWKRLGPSTREGHSRRHKAEANGLYAAGIPSGESSRVGLRAMLGLAAPGTSLWPCGLGACDLACDGARFEECLRNRTGRRWRASSGDRNEFWRPPRGGLPV